jgi:hypothetical protein
MKRPTSVQKRLKLQLTKQIQIRRGGPAQGEMDRLTTDDRGEHFYALSVSQRAPSTVRLIDEVSKAGFVFAGNCARPSKHHRLRACQTVRNLVERFPYQIQIARRPKIEVNQLDVGKSVLSTMLKKFEWIRSTLRHSDVLRKPVVRHALPALQIND